MPSKKALARQPEEVWFSGQIDQQEVLSGQLGAKGEEQKPGPSKRFLESSPLVLQMGELRLGKIGCAESSLHRVYGQAEPRPWVIVSPVACHMTKSMTPALLLCSLLKCLCTKNNF